MLTGIRDVQIAGKTLFLGMSMRVFPEERNIWISRLNKENLPSPMAVDIIQSFEGPKRSKRWRKVKFSFSLLELGCLSSPVLRHSSPWFSGLWTYTSVSPHHLLSSQPPFSGLQIWTELLQTGCLVCKQWTQAPCGAFLDIKVPLCPLFLVYRKRLYF